MVQEQGDRNIPNPPTATPVRPIGSTRFQPTPNDSQPPFGMAAYQANRSQARPHSTRSRPPIPPPVFISSQRTTGLQHSNSDRPTRHEVFQERLHMEAIKGVLKNKPFLQRTSETEIYDFIKGLEPYKKRIAYTLIPLQPSAKCIASTNKTCLNWRYL